MELKHNKHDIIIYILSFVLIVCLLVVSNILTNNARGKVLYAIVTIEGKQKFKLDMNEDKELVLSPDKYSRSPQDPCICRLRRSLPFP